MTSIANSATAVAHATEGAGNAPGRGGAYNGSSAPNRVPFRHIDDIVSVSVDLDPYTPLRKVLEAGDAHMQQAITLKDFNRPDLALQEYIKAFTIAVDKVPKHKDYPSLKSDRGALSRLYQGLKVKITQHGATFDRIKEIIKGDNLKSGVRPQRSGAKLPQHVLDLPSVPLSPVSQRVPDNHRNPSTNSSCPVSDLHDDDAGDANSGSRSRPTVLPKPQALHGKPIKTGSEKTTSDLAARFAKLRDPQELDAVRSSSHTKAGHLPSRSAFVLNGSLPTMPKIPDAIYSPVRGTVTSEAANLPSSTPRGMFSRTNSMASVHSGSPRNSVDSLVRPFNGERFVAAHTFGESQGNPTAKAQIPAGDVITVRELVRCMGSGSANIEILLIDVRDRQSFDDGHIMSQNTICLDPTILSRENISADDIVDSMILAPSSERAALERRDEVDLVVFYDQSSKSVPERNDGSLEGTVLLNLRLALLHYSYPKQLKNPPKLLAGGLDAWVDEMGRQSLQTSTTQSIVRQGSSTSASGRQRLRNRTLGPEEINNFEAMIGRDEEGDFDYARSREDFMRRFPSLKEPESMVSIARSDTSDRNMDSGSEAFLKDIAPMPPVRPKPSVARTRYSGLESGDEHMVPGALAMAAAPPSRRNPKLTGLVNIGNWCYANASIQALLASPGFADEFLDSNWPTKYRPNVKASEAAYNQLLCRILGNLFQWLSKRYFDQMKAATLMHYLRSIHAGYTVNNQTYKFGDTNQHDSDEFITFIFGQLEYETMFELPRIPTRTLNMSRPTDFVLDAWANRSKHNLISRYWYFLELNTLTCKTCKTQNFVSQLEERLICQVNTDGVTPTLVKSELEKHFQPETVMTDCDKCGKKGKTLTKKMVRLPPLLRVYIQRSDMTGLKKLANPVVFPFDDLDFTPYTLGMTERTEIAGRLSGHFSEGFEVTPRYKLCALVLHSGASLHSGHYISFVRGDENKWTRCDDTDIKTNCATDSTLHKAFGGERFTPVQLFYARVDREEELRKIYSR